MKYDGKADFMWFIEHHDELVQKHNGKVLAIRNREILGAYDTEAEALAVTRKTYPLGEFIIQLCTPGSEAYTIRNARIGALL